MLQIGTLTQEQHSFRTAIEALLGMPINPDALQAQGGTIQIATEEDALIGAFLLSGERLGEQAQYAVVSALAIAPAYRRHGMGRMLAALAANLAMQQGVGFLYAEVAQEAGVQVFAARIGATETAALRPCPAGAIPMCLDLTQIEGLRHGCR